jgi:glycosyltransferase involved in cell wall biosynthesis
MKILHLFSNAKWTGPAEPVVNLCRSLQERGADVTLACARGPRGAESVVAQRARECGLRTVQSLRLQKHFSPVHNLHDVLLLQTHLRAERYDLVHTHMHNDHLIVGFTARHVRPAPLIVRTSYNGNRIEPTARNRLLLTRYTDGLITCSHRARDATLSPFALPIERVWTVYGAVDVSRFDPARHLLNIRSRFGLTRDHFVVGVVARIQKHRKFDVFLEGAARAADQIENLRVMIIGRGTHMGQVAVEPSRRLHLQDCVVLPGYFTGDEYVATLNALDVKVYMVPGTDGTCRALLEAMALAKPSIVTAHGVLPEIVTHEFNGLVIKEDSSSLSDAIVRLAREPSLRRQLGLNAHKRAVENFSLAAQAAAVEDVYRSLLAMGPRHNRGSR